MNITSLYPTEASKQKTRLESLKMGVWGLAPRFNGHLRAKLWIFETETFKIGSLVSTKGVAQ